MAYLRVTPVRSLKAPMGSCAPFGFLVVGDHFAQAGDGILVEN